MDPKKDFWLGLCWGHFHSSMELNGVHFLKVLCNFQFSFYSSLPPQIWTEKGLLVFFFFFFFTFSFLFFFMKEGGEGFPSGLTHFAAAVLTNSCILFVNVTFLYFIKILTVGSSVEEAKKRIYACSTTTYHGFQCVMDEATSEKFRGML